jgi:hypothetical protein
VVKTQSWAGSKQKNSFSKIKIAIMGRKLVLDAGLACGNLQEESIEHSLG